MSRVHGDDARRIETIVAFWDKAGMGRWFAIDAAFDKALRDGFLSDHMEAAQGKLDSWQSAAHGLLALILLLDQIPRNIFRGTPHMFATDGLALSHARTALDRGCDEAFVPDLRMFFYLPFTHSECLEDQQISLARRRALGPRIERKAEEHLRIIERFGRFPHRNALLGRTSSAEELAYLEDGGFAG